VVNVTTEPATSADESETPADESTLDRLADLTRRLFEIPKSEVENGNGKH